MKTRFTQDILSVSDRAGFDNRTNGFVSQPEYDETKGDFEETDGVANGLGPVYNAQSCVACHQAPVIRAIASQQST